MNYDFSSQQHQRHELFDPYEVLELDRDADNNTIKQRFRKLTRVHHPDRNRNNPQYDGGKYYARVCAAYEILSDSRKRAAYDQQHAPSWSSMRDASQSYQPPAPGSSNNRRAGSFDARQKFGDNDLQAFNQAFEAQRKMNPNDRGYGDQMAARATEQDVKRGRTVDAPQNLFGSSRVSGAAFNERFESELQQRRQQQHQRNAMQERNSDPMGWSVGAGGGAAFSNISYYDGLMVDAEKQDFSKTDESTGLNYSDYMSGFSTFTEQLPEDHEYYRAADRDLDKYYNERLSQFSSDPDRGHNRTFAQSEALMNQQREQQLAAEQERNRQVVLKYRDQYSSDDLLPPSAQAHPAPPLRRNDVGFYEQQPAQYQAQQVQQHAQQPYPPYQPPQQQGLPFQAQQARGAPGAAGAAINNRMLDRQLDMIRAPPRKY